MNRKAFTLIEVIITAAILAAVALAAARMLKIPFAMQGWVSEAEVERQANTALDRWVKDLKEAVPNSIPWNAPPSPASLAFEKTRFDPVTRDPIEPIRIDYAFEASEAGTGTLYRIEAGTRSVILQQVLNPSESDPLFSLDGSLHIVMLSLKLKPAGRPAERFVRRVALSR
jgi:prepilin-type N-terminal cleavage/methylation domain-containing protein